MILNHFLVPRKEETILSITKEDAKYYYNKYAQAYEDAKANRNKAANAVESFKSQKKTQESDLEACKTQKLNFEERLADVKAIISLLDNNVPSSIEKANKSVSVADEKYVSAIKCSLATAASIKEAYYTKGVNEDANTDSAYTCCLDEKRRLEEGIAELRRRMNAISNTLDALNSSIRSATNAANAYHAEMNSYRNKANYYAMYL